MAALGMPEYRVCWEIDVQADTAREAAQKALEIQRDPQSIATVFEVDGVTIDLSEATAE